MNITVLKASINCIVVVANRIVGNAVWDAIVSAVNVQESTDKIGTEKRQAVLRAIEPLAKELFGWLVGMVVDIAVAKMNVGKLK